MQQLPCPSCRQQNPADASFCAGCGARLAQACASCGVALPPASRFCFRCGSAVAGDAEAPALRASPESYTPRHLAEKILASRNALEGERKQVTVLFADVKSSMELMVDRDPDEARKVLDAV